MGCVTVAGSKEIEKRALANGATEEQLLNAAGEALGIAISRHFSHPGTVVGYLGKGHNAGDALVALRILRDRFGWKIAARRAYPLDDCAPLTVKKWDELGLLNPLDRAPDWRSLPRPLLLLDGLIGTGASGPMREPVAAFAAEVNDLHQHAGAKVAAVDLPSGIDADSGEISPDTVTADITFTIANAKRGLLTASAAPAVGALALVPVAALDSGKSPEMELISPQIRHHGKAPRPFDFHKGLAGRVAIIAGSHEFTGAAVLATCGALLGGGGLVTLYVPKSIAAIIAGKCSAEAIIRTYTDPREILDSRFDALVAGCGLGGLDDDQAAALLETIAKSPAPVVIDAEALNLISKAGRQDMLAERHVVTPHPGEFARLAPDLKDLPREEGARKFADRHRSTLLLKGCRTIVTRAGEALWCNSTGTPAMATGGNGDLLSGVIGARLAIGDSGMEAATLGAWVCGRAAEIALATGGFSEESLLPTDAMKFLGAAFSDWRNSTR